MVFYNILFCAIELYITSPAHNKLYTQNSLHNSIILLYYSECPRNNTNTDLFLIRSVIH